MFNIKSISHHIHLISKTVIAFSIFQSNVHKHSLSLHEAEISVDNYQHYSNVSRCSDFSYVKVSYQGKSDLAAMASHMRVIIYFSVALTCLFSPTFQTITDENQAKQFLAELDPNYLEEANRQMQARWAYITDVNDENSNSQVIF